MPKKLTHNHKCEKCGEPAILNLQQNWQLFNITPNGNFKEADGWTGDNNEFYCQDCYDDEMEKTN